MRAALRCAALRCAALMLVSFTCSVATRGSTWIPLTVAEQASIADAIVVATVVRVDTKWLDDGEPVSLVRLQVSEVLRGSVPTGRLTLGLPGAYVDGKWVGVVGIPDVAAGDELVVFGDRVNDTDVQMVGALQSVFRKIASTSGTDIVADFEGNPVIDPGCTSARQIARPADQAPDAAEEGSDPSGRTGVIPDDRVFVADPSSLGMSWVSFVASVDTCVGSQLAALGSLVDVGGGW